MRAYAILLVLVAGCGDDDGGSRGQGELGGLCYPNGTCNVTLACQSGLCVAIDAGLVPDAAAADAGPFQCADDSVLEPNETTATAWVAPVDTQTTFNLAGLAICPSGDKDVYALQITTMGRNLEVLVTRQEAMPMLYASILNADGIAIANAASTTPRQIRAYVPNLPLNTYYVRVEAPAGVPAPDPTTNNYSMQINVTGP